MMAPLVYVCMCQGPKFPFANSCPHQQIEQMVVIGEPNDPCVVRTRVHQALNIASYHTKHSKTTLKPEATFSERLGQKAV